MRFCFSSLRLVFGAGLISASVATANAACVPTGIQSGTEISTLVAEGSGEVVMALNDGFAGVQSAVTESNAKQSQQIVSALEGFTQAMVAEIRQLPKTQAEIDRRRNELDPTRQMTDPCGTVARAADVIQTENIATAQEASLMRGAEAYNTSNVHSRGGNSGQMFRQAIYRNLQNRPNINAAPAKLATGSPLGSGAMTNSELQDAAFVNFVTTNPEPPAQVADPESPADISENVDASIFNMRMSLAQAAQNQILSYETPVLEVQEGSAYWEILANMGVEPPEGSDSIVLSKRQRMEVDATKRIKDPTFIAMLSGKDTSGALKDLAMAKAELLAQEFEGWKQDRNTVVLLAQLLAAKLREQE